MKYDRDMTVMMPELLEARKKSQRKKSPPRRHETVGRSAIRLMIHHGERKKQLLRCSHNRSADIPANNILKASHNHLDVSITDLQSRRKKERNDDGIG